MAEETSNLDPALAADRARSQAPLSDAEFSVLFAEIAAETVDRRAGLLERLRACATRTRIALGLGLGLGLGGAVLLGLGFRTDLREVGLWMPAMLVVLAMLGFLSVVVSLRGMHRRPLGRLAWMFSGMTLLGPLLLSLVPGLWPGHPVPEYPMPWETGCFWFGAAVALPSAGALVLLQREGRPAVWRILNAAGAGGCIGFIVQQLFCPANDLWHMVTAHGFLGLAVGIAFLVWVQIWPVASAAP